MEASIFSYNISPSEYFDDVESKGHVYKQAPLQFTREQYMNIVPKVVGDNARHNGDF